MFKIYLLGFLITLIVNNVCCWSRGAPAEACDIVSPSLGHGATTAVGPSPFHLTFSDTTFTPGAKLQVTLTGGKFHGFLIVARKSNGDKINIGTITDYPTNTQLTCNNQDGLTHVAADEKTSITFNWTAPSDFIDDVVVFKYAVVTTSKKNYFDGLSFSISKALPKAKSVNFTVDTDCGKDKGCYSDCVNNVCDLETTWQDKGDHLDITLKSILTNDSGYVSLGFSNASAMGPAIVYYCVLNNGSVYVIPGLTGIPRTHSHQEANVSTDGLKELDNSFIDGVLRCNFSLQKIRNNSTFDLNEPWYLIVARGPVTNGIMGKHTRAERAVTNFRVNMNDTSTNEIFSTVPATTTQPPPTTSTLNYLATNSSTNSASNTTVPITTTPGQSQPEAGKFRAGTGCGSTLGCYSNCVNNQCDLLVTWKPNGDKYEISLKTSTFNNNNYYIAIGLASVAKMGDANVMACTVNQGPSVDVFVSRNTKNYENIPLANPKKGVSLISGSYKEGILQCTFNRLVSIANDSDFYDMSKSWYLIVARGEAQSGGVLQMHDEKNRFLSQAQIDFHEVKTISLEVTKYPLIKAHGCLMVITWIFLASIGLAFARFLKPLWPNSMPCGVKVWFAMHRAFMVLAFLCGCAGFIIIFVEVKDYSEINGEFYKKAHPILGIITTALLVINPFMSLLRCPPDNPKRPYFNWAHRAAGTISHILATITVTVGLFLPKSQVDVDAGLAIMIVFSAWHLCYFLIMSLLNDLKVNIFFKKDKRDKKNAYSLKSTDQTDGTDNDQKPTLPNARLRQFLLALHVCMLSALTIALLYYIIDGNV